MIDWPFGALQDCVRRKLYEPSSISIKSQLFGFFSKIYLCIILNDVITLRERLTSFLFFSLKHELFLKYFITMVNISGNVSFFNFCFSTLQNPRTSQIQIVNFWKVWSCLKIPNWFNLTDLTWNDNFSVISILTIRLRLTKCYV